MFPVAAARVWNSLPEHVTSAPSATVFRSGLVLEHSWQTASVRYHANMSSASRIPPLSDCRATVPAQWRSWYCGHFSRFCYL